MTELGEIPIEWEIKRLDDIRDKNDKYSFVGGPFGSDLKSEHYTDKGIRVIQLQNICEGYFNNDYKIYTSIEKADQLIKCNIYPGELIIAKMAEPVARACKIPNNEKRYLMCSDGIRLVVDKQFNNTDYIMYSINSEYFRKNAILNSTGSTRMRIGLNELKSLPIIVPKLEEQKKIASILSTVDEQIDNVDALIEKNKELKKGLMQKLLSQGIGHTAFKKTEIGEIPEEWKVSKLGQLFYINTKSVEPSKLEEDILHYSLPAFDESRVPVKQSSIEIKSNKYLIEENSILVSKLNPRIKRIWLVNKVNFIKQICSTEFINYVAINKENVNLKYFEQYFNSDIFQQELLNRESGSTGSRKRVTPNSTMDIKIALPSSCEQEKIAIILSELDEKIEGYENKKEKLEELKKGLMQQLLTGKMRVV